MIGDVVFGGQRQMIGIETHRHIERKPGRDRSGPDAGAVAKVTRPVVVSTLQPLISCAPLTPITTLPVTVWR